MKRSFRVLVTMVLMTAITMGGSLIVNAQEQVVLKLASGAGPITKTIDEVQTAGDVGSAFSCYLMAIFNYTHPNITVKNVWKEETATKSEVLFPLLVAGEGPAVFSTSVFGVGSVAQQVQAGIEQGIIADLTKYMDTPEWRARFYNHLTPTTKSYFDSQLTVGGRIYGICSRPSPTGVLFRKDRFKEVGIFNARGDPSPPDDWALEDFREIAKKLTDVKKDRWGLILNGQDMGRGKTFLDRFGVEDVVPDKTGEYTWRSALALPAMIDALKFIQGMVWEDKSVLTGIDYDFGKVWGTFTNFNSPTSMFIFAVDGATEWSSHPFDIFKPLEFRDAIGIIPQPAGRGGIMPSTAIGASTVVNSQLNDAERAAAVEWLTWYYTTGYAMQNMWLYTFYYHGYDGIEAPINLTDRGWFGVPYVPWMRSIRDIIPEDYQYAITLFDKEAYAPSMSSYGLTVRNLAVLGDAWKSVYQMVISSPDTDVEKELTKAANEVNREALNYKDPQITPAKLKVYYTALGDFYQKTAPGFYSTIFLPALEKYYKVW